jgi:hypothetical protein
LLPSLLAVLWKADFIKSKASFSPRRAICRSNGADTWLRCMSFSSPTDGWVGSITTEQRLWKTEDGQTWIDMTASLPALPSAICGISSPSKGVVFASGTQYPYREAAVMAASARDARTSTASPAPFPGRASRRWSSPRSRAASSPSFDGQHRTTSAAIVGYESVPCQIVIAAKEEQAAAFKAINGTTEPWAVQIAHVCACAQVELLRYPVPYVAGLPACLEARQARPEGSEPGVSIYLCRTPRSPIHRPGSQGGGQNEMGFPGCHLSVIKPSLKRRKSVMRKHPLRKILFTLVTAFVVVPGLMITGVMAGSSAQQAGNKQARSAASSVVKHRQHLAREEFVTLGGAPAYNAVAAGKRIPDRISITNDRNLEGYPQPAH